MCFVDFNIFKMLVGFVILGVGVLVFVNKCFGFEDCFFGLMLCVFVFMLLGIFIIGMYDGFFGFGIGIFVMFFFVLVGFNFVCLSGNVCIINFVINFGVFIVFFIGGNMVWWIGLLMGVVNVFGVILGVWMVMLCGLVFVKWMYGFIVVLVVVWLFLIC